MIYLTRPPAIATAQTEARAVWLEQRGFQRCTPAAHLQAWRRNDARARAELAEQDARDEAARERAKIKGAMPGVVYPKKETGL